MSDRFRCLTCGKLVKDKFLFGLLHLCLTDEEIEANRRYDAAVMAQECVAKRAAERLAGDKTE